MESVKKFIYDQLAANQLSVTDARKLLKDLQEQSARTNDDRQDIAIIGMAGRFGEAEDLQEFWRLLKNGKDFVRELPKKRRANVEEYLNFLNITQDDVVIRQGGYLNEVDEFDHNFFKISAKEASIMDPNQRLFLEIAWKAVEDAGYGGDQLAQTRTGIFVGYCNDFGERYKHLIKCYSPSLLPLATLGNVDGVITGRISYLLDLKGPGMLVNTACSSSLVAVHLACQSIKSGDSDMAIAGGVKLFHIPAELKATGEFGGDIAPGIGIEASDGRCHTFDNDANGAGFGEGAGAIILKPLKKALADGDSIYAVIKGSAINQDGRSIGISAPNAVAQEEVLERAWKDAGIAPDTISYIEAHGTGTKLGDPIEVYALSRGLEKHTKEKQFCAIGSVKSNLGHLDHAAGIVGMIKAILSISNGQIVPSLNFQKPNRQINFISSPVYVSRKLTNWQGKNGLRRAGVSSFGISGTNCHVVLEESPKVERSATANSLESYLFTLSARTDYSLSKLIEKYVDFIEENSQLSLADLTYTANLGRGHYQHRLAFVVKSLEELLEKLKNTLTVGYNNLQDKSNYYGYHSIISEKHTVKKETDITVVQIGQLTKNSNQIVLGLKEKKASDYEKALHDLADCYVKGAEVNWKEMYQGQRYQRLHLPTYQFDRQRCWVEVDETGFAPTYLQSRTEKATDNSKKSETVKKKFDFVIKEDDGQLDEQLKKVAGIWAEVLGVKEISIFDDFYELGGDSIIGMTIVTKINKEFEIELPMAEIFTNPTISHITQLIPQQKASSKVAFTKIDRSSRVKGRM